MTTAAATTTTKATFSPPANIQRSPWHSPVPYLFGGLAAMLGLIAFALLILACSYWKLSPVGEDRGRRDEESSDAEKGESSSAAKAVPVFEEKFLVIMAGEVKPTFLATPIKASSSFNDGKTDSKEKENEDNIIKQKDEITTQDNGEESAPSPVGQEQSQ